MKWREWLLERLGMGLTHEEKLQVLVEDIREALPLLNQPLVLLRSRSLRAEMEAQAVYSELERTGKLDEPQSQEHLRVLVEDWRKKELLFNAFLLWVEPFKGSLRGVFDIQRETVSAVRLGLPAPRLTHEQEALLRDGLNAKQLAQQALENAQRAVEENRLDEYVKSLGYAAIPPELNSWLQRSFEASLEIIEALVVKEREEARQRRQEEDEKRRRADEEQQLEERHEKPSALPEQQAMDARKDDVPLRTTQAHRPKIFLIHGHDHFVLRSAEALLLRIGCQPIIFSRITNKATRTNIEILEEHLPSCDAVVVLLTPDDEGRKRGTVALEPRARQNVLVEAGYAIISRRATSLIVALEEVSIPSDFDGINRIQSSAWDRTTELELARELSDLLALPIELRHL